MVEDEDEDEGLVCLISGTRVCPIVSQKTCIQSSKGLDVDDANLAVIVVSTQPKAFEVA